MESLNEYLDSKLKEQFSENVTFMGGSSTGEKVTFRSNKTNVGRQGEEILIQLENDIDGMRMAMSQNQGMVQQNPDRIHSIMQKIGELIQEVQRLNGSGGSW